MKVALLALFFVLPFTSEKAFCQFPEVPGLILYEPIEQLASTGNVMIANIFVKRIYRSTNGGTSWNLSYKIDDANYIRSIGATHKTFFLAKDGGVFRSTDLGVSWNIIKYFTEKSFYSYRPKIVTIDSTVFIEQRGNLHYSTDEGISWNKLLVDSTVLRIERSSNNLIAEIRYKTNRPVGKGDTSIDRLLSTADLGTSWHQFDSAIRIKQSEGEYWGRVKYSSGKLFYGLPKSNMPLGGITVFSVSKGNAFILDKDNSLWTVSKNYSEWIRLFTFTDVAPTSLTAYKNTLVIGTEENGCFQSTDGGRTWKELSQKGLPRVSTPITIVKKLGNDSIYNLNESNMGWPTSEGNLYYKSRHIIIPDKYCWNWASTETAIFVYTTRKVRKDSSFYVLTRSTDFGKSWLDITMPGNRINKLYSNRNCIFAQTDKGFYRSINDGISWTKLHYYSFYPILCDSIIINQERDNTILRSSDNGDTWQRYRFPRTNGCGVDTWENARAFNFLNKIIVKTSCDQLFVSNDCGNSFSAIVMHGLPIDSLNIQRVTSIAVLDSILFGVGIDSSLYQSTDVGCTWNKIENVPVKRIWHVIVEGKLLSVNNYISHITPYFSRDAGATWTKSWR